MMQLSNKPWWDYLGEDLQELLEESQLLISTIEKNPNLVDEFHDYSFIVFPSAKAYEGFLKKLFLDLNFIRENDYYGKHFRIGKALNPELEKRFRKESVYDKITEFCGGKSLADKLWETWKYSRNLVFHWFPNEKRALTFEEAKQRIEMVLTAIDDSFSECKLKNPELEKSKP